MGYIKKILGNVFYKNFNCSLLLDDFDIKLFKFFFTKLMIARIYLRLLVVAILRLT